jgi:hypothetical protein
LYYVTITDVKHIFSTELWKNAYCNLFLTLR